MRRHAVVVLSLAALAALIAGAAGAQDTPSVIRVSTSTVDVRESSDTRSDVMFLWNREIRARPIGHAVLSCIALGSGGLLGRGVWSCTAIYVLPLGKISASGEIHSFRRYTLVVTGGTGRYLGAAGFLFSRREGPGNHRLIIKF